MKLNTVVKNLAVFCILGLSGYFVFASVFKNE